MTDEVVEPETYGALPLSYGARSSSRAGGTRTHNPRVMSHVLQSGSRSCFGGDEVVGQRHFRTGIEPANRFAVARLTGRSRCSPNRQSPCVFKKPNEGVSRAAFQRYGRPCQRSKPPIVDRPLCLGETPAPFTSRSPGIATLGPSCTPSRQLGMLFQKGAQRSVIETVLMAPGSQPGM
jgi:hypothetical protein